MKAPATGASDGSLLHSGFAALPGSNSITMGRVHRRGSGGPPGPAAIHPTAAPAQRMGPLCCGFDTKACPAARLLDLAPGCCSFPQYRPPLGSIGDTRGASQTEAPNYSNQAFVARFLRPARGRRRTRTGAERRGRTLHKRGDPRRRHRA